MKVMTAERYAALKEHDFSEPVDIDISRTQFLHVKKIGMTLVRLTQKGETIKHLSFWQSMTWEEINERFKLMPWKEI